MAFDFASFAAGLLAGAVTGALAGYLHETEKIGELQERVRVAILRFDRVVSEADALTDRDAVNADLRGQLSQLQEEIKRLYQRQKR